jgi:hypothetical protein
LDSQIFPDNAQACTTAPGTSQLSNQVTAFALHDWYEFAVQTWGGLDELQLAVVPPPEPAQSHDMICPVIVKPLNVGLELALPEEQYPPIGAPA